jgi:SRSO17 transposase
MQVPIVVPAPIVSTHAPAFKHLFNDYRQYQNFQNYLTGLIVLDNKSLANMSHCILESADKSNLSRFMGESPWEPSKVNQCRIEYMLSQTVELRLAAKASFFILDDTMCEHVGDLFEYVERHYNHNNNSFPLAHNLVTSHYLSGAVRFPLDFEIYRRYETVTEWDRFMAKHFPDEAIPKKAEERTKLHKKYDEKLLEMDPKFKALHEQFRTKINIAQMLVKQAIDQGVPFTTMLIDSWYLTPDLVKTLASDKIDWVSLLKRNRKLKTQGFQIKDAEGKLIPWSKPEIKVEDLVPLIPSTAYKPVETPSQTYWCFSLTVRLESYGKVRLVISFANSDLTGTYAVLITNRTDWSPKQIVLSYLKRWPIETFYRDSKQLLGLNEYRIRSLKAIEAHWCLVFMAYSLLHLNCLPPSSTKRKGKRPTVPNQSIGSACRQQGQALIKSLILFAHERFLKGCTEAQVFCTLFGKQNKKSMTEQLV